MRLFDIIHVEIGLFRDKTKSDEERKKAAYEAVKKLLRGFIFEWDVLRKADPPNIHVQERAMLEEYSSALIDLASEFGDYVHTNVLDELKQIAIAMKKTSSEPGWVGEGENHEQRITHISEECNRLISRIFQN